MVRCSEGSMDCLDGCVLSIAWMRRSVDKLSSFDLWCYLNLLFLCSHFCLGDQFIGEAGY